jgi:hypothetical protein
MESSDWFRRGALAPTGIEIGPAPGTEPRTIFTTEEIGRHSQCQLLSHYPTEVDRGRCRRQHINGRVVGRLGIVAEEDVQVLVDVVDQVSQTAAAIGSNVCPDPGSPKVLARPGCLEPPRHRDRSSELELEPLEGQIARRKPPDRLDRTSVESTEVDLKHSRLS